MRVVLGVALILIGAVGSAPAAEILLEIEQPKWGSPQLFGYSVANVGDVDLDGMADFIVGMPAEYLNNWNDVGHAYLFRGPMPLDATPYLTIQGDAWNSKMGMAVEAAGDLNLDGWPDFAVSESGAIHVFFGGPGLDAVPDLEIVGPPGEWFGHVLAGGKDLTGDGVADLATASPTHMVGGEEVGRVLVYAGGVGLDGIADAELIGSPGSQRLGFHLESVPDLDGDGVPDLVAYENHRDDATPDRVLIYPGGPTLGLAPAWKVFSVAGLTYETSMATVDLDGDGLVEVVIGLESENQVRIHAGATLADTPDRILTGRDAGEAFGVRVAAVGDVDGDGDEDLAVGARGDETAHLRGVLYIYGGGVSLPLTPILREFGPNATGRFAGGDMVGLGDFDGDGEGELLVGSGFPGRYVWIVDKAYFDCDDDGIPDRNQIVQGGPGDCDADGIPDACQVTWVGEDCDADGVPDACQIDQDPALDCDQDGTLDSCQIQADPSLDCDADGLLDACESPDPAAGCGVSTVALYSDPGFEENLVWVNGVGPAGTLRLVLRLPPGSPPVTWFQVRVEPPAGIALLEPTILVPDAFDGDPALEEIVIAFTTPYPVPPDGIVEIAEIPLLALGPEVADAEVALVASQSGAALPLWSDPVWADASSTHVVDRSFGAWINPGPTAVPGPERPVPTLSAYPNPFNPRVTLEFESPRSGPARLEILDLAGRSVAVLDDGTWPAGRRSVVWEGRDARGQAVSSGIYFARLRAADRTLTRKLVLVR